MYLHFFNYFTYITHEARGRFGLQGHSEIVALASRNHPYSSFCESWGGSSPEPVVVCQWSSCEFSSLWISSAHSVKLCFPAVSLIQTCRSQWKTSHLFQKDQALNLLLVILPPKCLPCLVLFITLLSPSQSLQFIQIKPLKPLCSVHFTLSVKVALRHIMYSSINSANIKTFPDSSPFA